MEIRNTYTGKVYNNRDLKLVVAALIENSAWFEVEPHPFDVYEVTVKPENRNLIHKTITDSWRLTGPQLIAYELNALYHAVRSKLIALRRREG